MTAAHELQFQVPGEGQVALEPQHGIIAGWTGRNAEAIERHIAELAAIGVPRPSAVPLYYRVAADLFTQAPQLQTVGPDTSGEVEPLLFDTGRALYLGLGSDHTDRALETRSVALSKQICGKPVASQAWRYDEVADHVERITLYAFVRDHGAAGWTLYQNGTIAAIRPLADLIAAAPVAAGAGRLMPGALMLCGTFPVVSGGVRPAAEFRMEMRDPVLNRTLAHTYATTALPIVA